MAFDYDAYKTGWSDHTPALKMCKECEESAQRLDEVQEYFKGVMDILYGKEKFSSGELERYLDEIAHQLQMPITNGELAVEKKRKTSAQLENWLAFSKETLNQA